ncbi:MAG TPA: 2OG-Fe(II) oxygenase [Dyella sp.]|uniref:2OG-Fe(II) oxygenase n=1 Tax=Dyella sp. TaxID=1869338 RepID=UPI002F91D3B2
MKSFHKIRPELREWILATARAGHGVPDVLRLLKEAGYDAAQARRAVSEVLNIPLTSLNAVAPRPSGRRPKHPEAPQVDVDGRAIRIAVSVESPALRVLEGLLTDEECEQLIALAKPRMHRAMTVDVNGKQQVDEARTSQGMFFTLGETPLIAALEARLANLLDMPVEFGEGLQVLHYLPGQEYEAHQDWFDPSQPGFTAITAKGGQRVASVVMYLNTPEEGGGTGFPAIGMVVTARQGSAVYFAYETGEQASLHAGLPVSKGEKWIATKWLRERPFRA